MSEEDRPGVGCALLAGWIVFAWVVMWIGVECAIRG